MKTDEGRCKSFPSGKKLVLNFERNCNIARGVTPTTKWTFEVSFFVPFFRRATDILDCVLRLCALGWLPFIVHDRIGRVNTESTTYSRPHSHDGCEQPSQFQYRFRCHRSVLFSMGKTTTRHLLIIKWNVHIPLKHIIASNWVAHTHSHACTQFNRAPMESMTTMSLLFGHGFEPLHSAHHLFSIYPVCSVIIFSSGGMWMCVRVRALMPEFRFLFSDKKAEKEEKKIIIHVSRSVVGYNLCSLIPSSPW